MPAYMKYDIMLNNKMTYINEATVPNFLYGINDVKEPKIKMKSDVGIEAINAPGFACEIFNLKLGA